MTKAKTYSETVIYDTNKRFNKLVKKPDELELIGKGRSAYVFKLREQGREMALKVFFPEFKETAQREAEIYKKLSDSPYYPDIYETGHSYILMEYIKGHTFYECLNKGIRIEDEMIQEVDRALQDARLKGLNPSDIHLRNLILTPSGSVKVIDVARFSQTKACKQWEDLKSAYQILYKKSGFPQKIPKLWMETIAFLYKKNWLQKQWTARKNKFHS
ncbi:protein kinase family protein [Bacillus swezeyi]|uniref:Serine/threonine protein kinase n=1 Tax=Bacillus swezeyi TaxID=1925020 RepID=A0A1R1Q8Y3_9BACI|nr:phosphotransferase [Bacillus swezeyi]MEC1261413.1 protein kinase family protein [Bacillus swezeyi]MED2929114.1 protein kinase family protein [Bacillus swezeyi]MED2940915.1 protein kinase family protein [Bacillus swezeyi]MED2963857.1 protein kinase family protein [Bacillus swezeyi]MED3073435.1 protein kinase family protein [Bacillus swezeyi]